MERHEERESLDVVVVVVAQEDVDLVGLPRESLGQPLAEIADAAPRVEDDVLPR